MDHTNIEIHEISAPELKKRYDNDPSLCLIDVRENDEWKEQHISWAKHIPKGQLGDNIAALVPNKDHPIYLHCRGGVRSLHAAEALRALGYRNLYSIEGGIMAWISSGYPVIMEG